MSSCAPGAFAACFRPVCGSSCRRNDTCTCLQWVFGKRKPATRRKKRARLSACGKGMRRMHGQPQVCPHSPCVSGTSTSASHMTKPLSSGGVTTASVKAWVQVPVQVPVQVQAQVPTIKEALHLARVCALLEGSRSCPWLPWIATTQLADASAIASAGTSENARKSRRMRWHSASAVSVCTRYLPLKL